ncbi:outer membrane protein [Bartonella sp. F02]|uniref:outer membrane protein n=1 Tax=Bartonella sp. F02 TaxID=2967262 RepID=UPI0022A9F22A|nr:outer membrane beta-barrel protein [Bartonella sp. F02]MCZ2328098.1 porin family protein [Bartonella sp. F02]
MNIKCLITASVFALISVSVAQAADVTTHHKPASVMPQVMSVSTVSWSGFYMGAQLGGFLSKVDFSAPKETVWFPLKKDKFPKLSGLIGGLYAGSNIDFGDSFIIGIDTGVILSGSKDTKTIVGGQPIPPVSPVGVRGRTQGSRGSDESRSANGEHTYPAVTLEGCAVDNSSGECDTMRVRLMLNDFGKSSMDAIGSVKHTLKQKWSGATRVRFGFTADRIMPYIAGGVAYTQLQDTISVDPLGTKESVDISDETKTLVGYTLGGGLDFAVNDNVILRAEYRYSDFGKKKFMNDKVQLSYTTNDFRVGVAYKF